MDGNEEKNEKIRNGSGPEPGPQPGLRPGPRPGSGSAGTDGDRLEAEKSALLGKVEELESRLAGVEAENTELKDQNLRRQAEFENFRKRMNKSRQEAIQFGNQQLLEDLMTVLDDFERAVKSGEDSRDFTAFHDGIVLIEKQFAGLLQRKWGLRRFDSVGEVFDPGKHEAVTTEERADHESSVVLEDYQKGYYLHDRVLRAAKVKVSLPGAAGGTKKSEVSSDATRSAERKEETH